MKESRKNWTDDEDKAITALVKKHGTKNWAEISQKMANRYGIEIRTGKQCRERWHNHLDPQINKEAWSAKEEKIMFEAHQKYGNRWTEIAKLFEGRTDNDIKNHFYSMLRRSLRRVNKLLGMRNSTRKIRVIKPCVLSKIFVSNSPDYETLDKRKKVSEALFEFSMAKSHDGSALKEEEKKSFQELIQQLIEINQEYDLKRSQKRSQQEDPQEEDHPLQQEGEKERDHSIKQTKPRKNNKKQSLSERSIRKRKSHLGLRSKSSIHSNPSKKEESATRAMRKKKKISQTQHRILSKQSIPQRRKKQSLLEEKEKQKHRLQKNQNYKEEQQLLEQIDLGEELPELNFNKNKSSSFRMEKISSSSNSSNNFYLSGLSPRIDSRIFTQTPKMPTPNLIDAFSKSNSSMEWTTTNNDLDEILQGIKKRTWAETKQLNSDRSRRH